MSIPEQFKKIPSHWEVLPFTEAVKDATSGNVKIQKNDYLSSGRIPIVDQGQAIYAGFTDNQASICKSVLPTIVFGDHTRAFKYIEQPFTLGADGAKVLEPTASLDKRFLFHYLKQLKIESAGYSRHYKFLKETYVPLPPLPEQKRLAAIFDKADAIRRKRQQAIQLADDFLRAVFLDMFGDSVTNPKGWEVKKFGDLGHWASGGTPSRAIPDYFEGEINWFSAGELNHRYVAESKEKITDEALTKSAAKIFPVGSMLVGMYDTAAFKISILNKASASNQACANIIPNELIDIEWFFSFIEFSKETYLRQRRGVRQKNLNLGMIKEFELPLPPKLEQMKFVKLAKKTMLMKERKYLSLNLSENSFNSLSQKGFAGQL